MTHIILKSNLLKINFNNVHLNIFGETFAHSIFIFIYMHKFKN